MSYADAMRAAAMGKLDDTVIEAIRRELAAVERSGPVSRQVDVQNNLGSALLNMANAAGNPVEYVRMYKESEDLLLKVLQLQPSYTGAKANLATVRKNLKIRVDGNENEGDNKEEEILKITQPSVEDGNELDHPPSGRRC